MVDDDKVIGDEQLIFIKIKRLQILLEEGELHPKDKEKQDNKKCPKLYQTVD